MTDVEAFAEGPPLWAVLLVAAIGAYGGEDKAAPAQPVERQQTAGRDCRSVKVTGHEAVEIKASGASCEVAKEVVVAAEGRGRAPYEKSGLNAAANRVLSFFTPA